MSSGVEVTYAPAGQSQGWDCVHPEDRSPAHKKDKG